MAEWLDHEGDHSRTSSRRRLQVAVKEDPKQAREFDAAFECLAKLVDLRSADSQFPTRGNTVFTTAVVLWMLVSQRMSADRTLEATVKRLLSSRPEILPENQRVTRQTLSANTSGYSAARQRLELRAVEWFCNHVAQSIVDTTKPSLEGRRAFVLDGTTLTLAPEPVLRKLYPPAKNQYGRGAWPIALMTVCHELRTGAAMIPALGRKFGPEAVSETSLVPDCLRQLPSDSIVMADAGFGIFQVAWQIDRAGHQFVLRLTPQRFEALKRQATPIEDRGGSPVWQLDWTPSRGDCLTHPELPDDARLSVRLHEIRINDELTLRIVTSLPTPSTDIADLYAQRTHVEIDIRNTKIVLGAERILARSQAMFQKELLAAVIAYNLTTQFRRQAAEVAELPPRRLSYKRVWTTFNVFLLSSTHTNAAKWREAYSRALMIAATEILPDRPGRRFRREAYPRRPKSNQFQKRVPKEDTLHELVNDADDPPPDPERNQSKK